MSRVILKYLNKNYIAYQWAIVPVASVRTIEREMRSMIKLEVIGERAAYIHVDLDKLEVFDGDNFDGDRGGDMKPLPHSQVAKFDTLGRAIDQVFATMVQDLLGHSAFNKQEDWDRRRVLDFDTLWTFDATLQEDRDKAIVEGITGWKREQLWLRQVVAP